MSRRNFVEERICENKYVWNTPRSQSTTTAPTPPTLTTIDTAKEIFFSEFDNVKKGISKRESLAILGDLNARVGRDHVAWNGIIGTHELGNMNGNEERLHARHRHCWYYVHS